MSNKITVIGSSNTDMVIKSERIPVPGETILGGDFLMTDGGKGANQAAAAAKLGGNVGFIAKLGKDMFGDAALKKYASYGINTENIFRDDAPSGVALIMVDAKGENSISVATGANANLSVQDIDNCKSAIQQSEIVLMQLEISVPSVAYAAETAWNAGVKVVLNPAPAAQLPHTLYPKLYMITPNRTEAELLTGMAVTDLDSAKQAAAVLAGRGVSVVVITLGSQGALVLEKDEFTHIEACPVKAVDTTAAGDVFNGAVCVALSEGKTVIDAVKFGSKAAALSVTRMGAQSSIPKREEVDNFACMMTI